MKKSAGLLLFRNSDRGIEVLLVHAGGPFWARRDGHAWSIPKGEFADDEDPLTAWFDLESARSKILKGQSRRLE